MIISDNKRKELKEIRVMLQKALEHVDAILTNREINSTKKPHQKRQILAEPLVPTGKPIDEKNNN